jgi:hypothetical protein
LVARRAHNPKVVGSNPAPATIYNCMDAGVRAPQGAVAESPILGFFIFWALEILKLTVDC